MKHVKFLLFLYFVAASWSKVLGLIYVEDLCIPSENITLASSGYLKATRNSSYFVGRNCSFVFSSSRDIIISIKSINFRPGCKDYLKVVDEAKQVALCGTKHELDSNMQYYGKKISMNYYTEEGGVDAHGYDGFNLTYTISEKKKYGSCNKFYTFQCSNGYCVHNHFICDGNNNCGDFSDEQSCNSLGVGAFLALSLVATMGIMSGYLIYAVIDILMGRRVTRTITRTESNRF